MTCRPDVLYSDFGAYCVNTKCYRTGIRCLINGVAESIATVVSDWCRSDSEAVKTAEGRHYHLDLAPGGLANYILLCVDPAKARRVAELFDEAMFDRSS